MKDVAARAGVGLSTVSRVVSGKGGVSRAKTAAVEAAIKALDFSRNDFAHTLRTGTAGTIGVVVTRISDPFYSTLVSAIEHAARERDVLVLVASTTDDADEAKRVVKRLLQRRLDGLVMVVPEETDLSLVQRELDKGVPIVFVDRPPTNLEADSVVVDNEAGVSRAIHHLIDHGHQRIACFAHREGAYTAGRREAGYRAALRERGIAVDEDLIATVPDDVAACAAALRGMLALAEPPTAIFTTNSRTTKAVYAALRQARLLRAVVGFDDFELADLMTPPLSAIAQSPLDVGAAAAELLFQRIAGLRGPRRRVTLGTELLARGSGELTPRDVAAGFVVNS